VKPIYTEDQIRKAWITAFGGPHMHADPTFPTWSSDALVRQLKEDDHVHDFADTDTITVKELREAWMRANAPETVALANYAIFLTDISKHREPEYPAGTVWKDRKGVIYRRTVDGRWQQFGTSSIQADIVPSRPLSQMIEVPF
jgi:hypothetical protein